jgi:hypothetical protein
MNENYRFQIVALWSVFLLGTLFHVQLGLMPLFHGLDVSISHAHAHQASEITPVLWGMLAFFGIPMGAIVLAAFTKARSFRRGHFWLTILYSVLNFFHAGADLFVPPRVWPQVLLMVILFGVGLLLNRVSWQWLRDRPSTQKSPSY